jgi:hypothetical protein
MLIDLLYPFLRHMIGIDGDCYEKRTSSYSLFIEFDTQYITSASTPRVNFRATKCYKYVNHQIDNSLSMS